MRLGSFTQIRQFLQAVVLPNGFIHDKIFQQLAAVTNRSDQAVLIITAGPAAVLPASAAVAARDPALIDCPSIDEMSDVLFVPIEFLFIIVGQILVFRVKGRGRTYGFGRRPRGRIPLRL